MALAREAMGGGLSSGTARALNGQLKTLAAAGTTQTDATACTTSNTYITTTASGAGVIIPDGDILDSVIVYNAGANAAKVYPVVGDAFNQLAVNTAFSLAPNTGCLILKVSASLWLVFMSA